MPRPNFSLAQVRFLCLQSQIVLIKALNQELDTKEELCTQFTTFVGDRHETMCGGAYHKTAEPAGSIVRHKLHFKSKGRSVFTAKSAESLLLCSTCWVLLMCNFFIAVSFCIERG